MIRINLLPHREEKRRYKRQQFFALAGLVAVLAVAIVGLGWSIISGYIGAQNEKNEFLKREIASLDKQIAQIKDLQANIRLQVARKEIIESLQRDRSEPVAMLNELAKQVPDGVYIKSFKQTGATIALEGVSQSNARVSTLMRNLESSPTFQDPKLIETKATSGKDRRYQEFRLTTTVTREPSEAEKEDKRASPQRGLK
jgi:type IV pilus assembly protein PilN